MVKQVIFSLRMKNDTRIYIFYNDNNNKMICNPNGIFD